MISRILANTPAWAWAILVALIALGIQQSRGRRVAPRSVLVLPAAMTALSLAGSVSTFGFSPLSILAWAAALACVGSLLGHSAAPAGSAWDAATQRLLLPGSWQPLALMLALFVLKFAMGVIMALDAALAAEPAVTSTVSLLYGALSGAFVGRAWRVWRLRRSPAIDPAAPPAAGWRGLAGVALAAAGSLAAILAAMIAWDGRPPPPLATMARAFDLSGETLPPPERYPARDGAQLAFRAYRVPGAEAAAILVHGSAGDSHAMHFVARELAAAGIAAYALDIRGHGASGRRGDIEYLGQLQDDLEDFLAHLDRLQPSARRILVGHSSGGGFALRIAGGRLGERFERYLLLAPMLHQSAPTTRPNAGGWVRPVVPRLVALGILDNLGLRWFQHLPVLRFALPPEAAEKATPAYSWRLQANFRPREDFLADVAAARRPVIVLVGADDELFVAAAYAPLLEPRQPLIKVAVLPGVSHLGVVHAAGALAAVVAAARTGATGAR